MAARVVTARGSFGDRHPLDDAPIANGIGIVAGARRITVAWGASNGVRVATYTP
jgi:hypothetical protein